MGVFKGDIRSLDNGSYVLAATSSTYSFIVFPPFISQYNPYNFEVVGDDRYAIINAYHDPWATKCPQKVADIGEALEADPQPNMERAKGFHIGYFGCCC